MIENTSNRIRHCDDDQGGRSNLSIIWRLRHFVRVIQITCYAPPSPNQ